MVLHDFRCTLCSRSLRCEVGVVGLTEGFQVLIKDLP